jgi:hypothetical protein
MNVLILELVVNAELVGLGEAALVTEVVVAEVVAVAGGLRVHLISKPQSTARDMISELTRKG